jgi:hypothetical protein
MPVVGREACNGPPLRAAREPAAASRDEEPDRTTAQDAPTETLMKIARLIYLPLIAVALATSNAARADSAAQIFQDWVHTVKAQIAIDDTSRKVSGNKDISHLERSIRYAADLAKVRLEKLPCKDNAEAEKSVEKLQDAIRGQFSFYFDGKYEAHCAGGLIKVTKFDVWKLQYK